MSYSSARKSCPTESLIALERADSLVQRCRAPEPILLIHLGMCELRWANIVAFTFSDDRETLIMIDEVCISATDLSRHFNPTALATL